MRHLALLGIFLFPAAFPAALSAQTTASPEVFARVGVVKLWDDEGNIGVGPSIAVGAGIRLAHGFGIEGFVERHTNDRNFSSGVSFTSTVIGGSGRILKYIGASRAQPYFGTGIGMARIKTESQFPGFGRNERTTTSTTFTGFTGARIAVGRHMFVRPEFELAKAGEHLRIGGSVAAGLSW